MVRTSKIISNYETMLKISDLSWTVIYPVTFKIFSIYEIKCSSLANTMKKVGTDLVKRLQNIFYLKVYLDDKELP